MWQQIERYAALFNATSPATPNTKHAIISHMDEQGHPFTIRCQATIDAAAQTITVHVADAIALRESRASLLFHTHDDLLGNLKSFVLRGQLVQADGTWRFNVSAVLPGFGVNGNLGDMMTFWRARQSAGRYLKKLGIPRPAIPWEKMVEELTKPE